jgi:rhodanese-related sulfurtransferase
MENVERKPAADISDDELANWIVLDVREQFEFEQGHLPGAINLPRSRMELLLTQSDELEQANEKPVLVYCASGKRSLLAAQALTDLGANRVVSMDGGFQGWAEKGGAVSG